MARRKRASMREGPLADLFRSTDKPEDPPEAPAPPPRRSDRDDETRVMPETPREEAPERRPEPPPEREPIFDVEEEEPQREDVRAYRVEESAPEAPAPPTKKARLSKTFAEDAAPALAGDSRGRGGRSRRQRRQPHGRGRHPRRRVHGDQHRPSVAPAVACGRHRPPRHGRAARARRGVEPRARLSRRLRGAGQ